MIDIFSNKRIVLRALLTTLMLSAVFILDPLGIRDAGEEHYENVIIRFFSPHFSDEISKDITVVLLDESYLEQLQEYPVSYNNLSRLLKKISSYEPELVFFDILQHYKHSKNFNSWLRMIDSRDYPVIMASHPSYDTQLRLNDDNSIRSKINNVAEIAAVSWEDEGRAYPFKVTWNDGEMDTVAFNLYKKWCKENNCTINESLYTDSMIVQWTNKFDINQDLYYPLKNQCITRSESNWLQSLEYIWVGLTKGIRDENNYDRHTRNLCPPFTSVAASILAKEGHNSERLKAALKDRIILIGYDLEGGVDIVESPVHGILAGVYFHAMALDNLINFSDQYWHVPEDLGVLNLSYVDFFELIVQGLVLFLVILFRFKVLEKKNSDNFDVRENIFIAIIPALCILTLITVLIFILSSLFNVGVPNWYGLLMILIFDLPVFIFFIFEALKGKIEFVLFKIRLFFRNYISDTRRG